MYAVARPDLTLHGRWMAAVLACGPGALPSHDAAAALWAIVETDGLRYHRTAAQQARDRLRDQAHAAAGLMPLRFTRAQVRYEPEHVQATLAAVAGRLAKR